MIADKYYKQALLIRRTEETFLELFSQGKLNGTVHTCSGQEFSGISFCKFLHQGDFIFSNHRCHGHYLAHTNDVGGLIAELMGKISGTCGGIGSSQHLCNENFFSKKKIYKDGINIDHEPNKNKKGILDGEGDFVDYEEVD